MSRFFATYETETNISSVSVSEMQALFQHYSLQPKPEFSNTEHGPAYIHRTYKDTKYFNCCC